jgi:tetratricopeptide (TPR) repeat protein
MRFRGPSRRISCWLLPAACGLLLLGCPKTPKVLPEGPEARARRFLAEGKAKHEAGDYPAAKKLLEAAIAEKADLGPAYTLLGREALAGGDASGAKALFEKAVSLDASDAEATLGLGTAETQLGDLSAAEKALLRARDLSPESPRVYYFLGELYAKGGRPAEAEAAYRDAIRFDPGYAWPRLGLARLLRQRGGAKEEAFRLAQEAAQADDALDEPHHLLGLLYSDDKDYPKAEAEFREALKRNEKSPRNQMNLGTILAWQGKLDDAVEAFRAALALDPSYPLAQNNLGHVLRQSGKVEEAIPYLKKAVELAPAVPLYSINLGDALSVSGRFLDAAAAYRAALTLAPDQASIASKLALVLSQGGDIPAAYAALKEFVAAHPVDPGLPALREEMTRLAREELKQQLK